MYERMAARSKHFAEDDTARPQGFELPEPDGRVLDHRKYMKVQLIFF